MHITLRNCDCDCRAALYQISNIKWYHIAQQAALTNLSPTLDCDFLENASGTGTFKAIKHSVYSVPCILSTFLYLEDDWMLESWQQHFLQLKSQQLKHYCC